MFSVPAAIRRVSGPPPVEAPIFTGPVTIPAQDVDTAFSWDMSQYFSGDPVDSYALTNDGGQAWLSINTSTGELSGQTPATPVTVSGVIVTATNTGGSTPTDAFGFEVVSAGYGDDFVTEWHVEAGDLDITIPTNSGGNYNGVVDWGDGSPTENITGHNVNNYHLYASPGDYEVTISGQFSWIYFNNGGDRLKITRVKNFGKMGWTALYRAFYGCQNMVEFTAGSTEILPVATYAEAMFWSCDSCVYDFGNEFNTNNCTHWANMFRSASDFDASSFDIGSMTVATNFAYLGDLSNANYDALLIAWAAQAPNINNSVPFHAGAAQYSAGAAADARLVLTDTYSWNITDGGLA